MLRRFFFCKLCFLRTFLWRLPAPPPFLLLLQFFLEELFLTLSHQMTFVDVLPTKNNRNCLKVYCKLIVGVILNIIKESTLDFKRSFSHSPRAGLWAFAGTSVSGQRCFLTVYYVSRCDYYPTETLAIYEPHYPSIDVSDIYIAFANWLILWEDRSGTNCIRRNRTHFLKSY